MNNPLTQDRAYSPAESARYRVLVEAITDYAVYMLDPTGIVNSWNAGAQRFKGYKPEEIIGQHFSRFYTAEDRASGLPARALRISAQEGKFEAEGWRVRKDGSRFWAHVVIDPIRDEAGKLVGFAKVTRDLSERRATEEALRRSEEQFRLLVQGVTDYAIYMLSPEGIVTNWNPGARRIKGYSPEEIIGKHFSNFYTPEDRAAGMPARALATAAKEGKFEAEGWRLRKDGSRFWAHVVIDPIRDQNGALTGFAKITRDITERKATQESLERAREALFQSQKMDAIGQLTGGVAHDFNNLLMAVLGSLELLRKRLPDDPAQLRLLDNAIQGARRGATLTQRMLSFARRQELDVHPLDVAGLVRGMADLLERTLGKDVDLRTEFSPGLPLAIADDNQLELALLNLCVNARDAMRGGGRIVIAAREEEIDLRHASGLPPGKYVCLSVTDTGEGMDQETLARATEPFFTTKGVGKGTGLGLSMVHGMAEQMGGRLILHSKPGEGTTAEIWLPSATSAARARQEAVPAPEPPAGRRRLKVLAVDDDLLVLFNTVAMLEDLGHEVVEAGSGPEALEHLARQSFDLVITDQSMPRMSGTQLIEAIARDWPDLKVILATGYAELPDGVQVKVPKLNKPFNERDLKKVLAGI
ncbi:MAG: PAS domain S-box protein [Alphaproteobacteria bacterium]|nr:PAS domain S-box protein [Alphaproteobacteria bacterium]